MVVGVAAAAVGEGAGVEEVEDDVEEGVDGEGLDVIGVVRGVVVVVGEVVAAGPRYSLGGRRCRP